MDEEVLVPFFLFATLALVFWGGFKFSASKRLAALETVRAVVEKTGEATPELIEAIGADVTRKNQDLRKGLMLVAIALAIVGMAVLLPREAADEISGALLGLALFPGLVGLVYVAFHYTNEKSEPET